MEDKRLEATARLLEVMNTLRRECPWDREQTFDSLRSNTIEETYELADAITAHNMEGIKEELGDLLLHVVFYSKLGEEQGAFDFGDVANALCDKLIYRHPHVYGDIHANTPDEVKEEIAEVEAEMRAGRREELEGEFGDLFFALVNAARLYGVDPESALARTNEKFIRRFNCMEEKAASEGHTLHEMTLDEMEALWQRAKREE